MLAALTSLSIASAGRSCPGHHRCCLAVGCHVLKTHTHSVNSQETYRPSAGGSRRQLYGNTKTKNCGCVLEKKICKCYAVAVGYLPPKRFDRSVFASFLWLTSIFLFISCLFLMGCQTLARGDELRSIDYADLSTELLPNTTPRQMTILNITKDKVT